MYYIIHVCFKNIIKRNCIHFFKFVGSSDHKLTEFKNVCTTVVKGFPGKVYINDYVNINLLMYKIKNFFILFVLYKMCIFHGDFIMYLNF